MSTEDDAFRERNAIRSLQQGAIYPYDAPWPNVNTDDGVHPPEDWAHAAARGILHDLNDRSGIKQKLREIDMEVRIDIIQSLRAIINEAFARREPS